jgi:hypothetical protein
MNYTIEDLSEHAREIRQGLRDKKFIARVAREEGTSEDAVIKRLGAELKETKRVLAELEARRAEILGALDDPTCTERGDGGTFASSMRRTSSDHHPLAFSAESLDVIQASLDTRESGRFEARLEERAALATATLGAPRAWSANVLTGPRLLHRAAGVPQSLGVGTVAASFPVLTLPTGAAGVAENTTLSEFAASTAGTATLQRYGRFTDLSTEARLSTDVSALLAIHQLAIAKDLDTVLVNAVETAAGAAVAFVADVPAQIRKQMSAVLDNTAATSATDLVILVNPADANLLQDVSPISGSTIAEGFQRFSGALVYPSAAVDAGFMTVANLRAGARYFEARALTVETNVDVKTGVVTLASSVIAAYGLGLLGGASGFAIKQDVIA